MGDIYESIVISQVYLSPSSVHTLLKDIHSLSTAVNQHLALKSLCEYFYITTMSPQLMSTEWAFGAPTPRKVQKGPGANGKLAATTAEYHLSNYSSRKTSDPKGHENNKKTQNSILATSHGGRISEEHFRQVSNEEALPQIIMTRQAESIKGLKDNDNPIHAYRSTRSTKENADSDQFNKTGYPDYLHQPTPAYGEVQAPETELPKLDWIPKPPFEPGLGICTLDNCYAYTPIDPDKRWVAKDILVKHAQRAHPQYPNACPVCRVKFQSRLRMESHMMGIRPLCKGESKAQRDVNIREQNRLRKMQTRAQGIGGKNNKQSSAKANPEDMEALTSGVSRLTNKELSTAHSGHSKAPGSGTYQQYTVGHTQQHTQFSHTIPTPTGQKPLPSIETPPKIDYQHLPLTLPTRPPRPGEDYPHLLSRPSDDQPVPLGVCMHKKPDCLAVIPFKPQNPSETRVAMIDHIKRMHPDKLDICPACLDKRQGPAGIEGHMIQMNSGEVKGLCDGRSERTRKQDHQRKRREKRARDKAASETGEGSGTALKKRKPSEKTK